MTATVRELRARGVSEDALRLRTFRRTHRGRGRWLRLDELAPMIGLSLSTLQKFEVGDGTPQPETVAKVKAFLDGMKDKP